MAGAPAAFLGLEVKAEWKTSMEKQQGDLFPLGPWLAFLGTLHNLYNY